MFIKVNIRTAKLVVSKNSDYIIDVLNDKVTKRTNFVDVNNLIICPPISNMLHVLMGERPVPTFRESMLKPVERIYEIAKNGYYKLDFNPVYTDKNGKTRVVKEFHSGKKMHFMSQQQHDMKVFNDKENDEDNYIKGYITWSMFKRGFMATIKGRSYDENINKYNLIIEKIKFWTNNEDVQKYMTITDALIIIKNSKYKDEAAKFFKEQDVSTFSDFVLGKSVSFGNFTNNRKKLAFLAQQNNLYDTVNLSGEFVFEVTEDEYENLVNGPQFATYLDGGLAELDLTKYYKDDIDFDEYKKIFND